MSKLIKIIFSIALSVALLFCLLSCETAKTYEDGYIDGCSDGHFFASEEFSEHSWEMYKKGYNEAYDDFVYGIIDNQAIHYARKFSEYHPEEAMCIIDCYKNGTRYWGKLPITDADYSAAVESLYRYYEYFLNAWYNDDAECDYDDYEHLD